MYKNKLRIIQFIPLLIAFFWHAQNQNYICISLILFLLLAMVLGTAIQQYLHKYVSIPINISQIHYSIHRLVKIDSLMQLVFKLSHIHAPNQEDLNTRKSDFKIEERKRDKEQGNIIDREKMQNKYNLNVRKLESVKELLRHIEQMYFQIRKQLPTLMFPFPDSEYLDEIAENQDRKSGQKNQKGNNIKQNRNSGNLKQIFENNIDMGKKIQIQLSINEEIYGKRLFLARLIWKLRKVYELWLKIQELFKKSQKDENFFELLSAKNQILINTIKLAFKKEILKSEESNQRARNAILAIDQYFSLESQGLSTNQHSLNLNSQYFNLNDLAHNPSDQPPKNKFEESPVYDRQKFKSELNHLLLKGLEQRKIKEEQDKDQAEQNITILETKIKYDQNTKQYQIIDLDMDDNSDHDN